MKRLPLNPRVLNFVIQPDYKLAITFKNCETKIFDTQPYLDSSEFFRELLNESYFAKAFLSGGTIEWPNGQDFCPDT
ncbi:MAG: DUF2442 domain-containing protein, partial [Planctomycetaceae bacterium]|nr:DUF2442 domain-containing protein [Planctomycetaceae bacterium]